MSIPFVKDLQFSYGTVSGLSPLVRRVIASNPSAFTFHGTGTYILGHRDGVAVIDPGPDDAAHIEALLQNLDGETVTHILITHTHRDHSPGARLLKQRTGAPTYGFGPHPPAKTVDGVVVEEGGDHDFVPDHVVTDGEVIRGKGWTVTALHTPGHISNHLCFALHEEKALFSGDHVMGWSTTVISPPDGNMTDYYASLKKLLPRDDVRYYPTHGAPIDAMNTGHSPQHFVRELIKHREAREAQIVDCLTKNGPQTIPQMVTVMYAEVPKYLHPAAARSVLAHLIHMVGDGRVAVDGGGEADEAAVYRVA
ncbi:MBL fold metallo-hydrolase [Ferrovibrio sp.]|uniref:MBL fold metallo-hydrolase n=1 Tax=Ferrovibrio sp. TaxID=1917215 RepID=UPI000CC4FBFB|nr:MBL fold metallo-hydrolase [Ferrovibrio sp.]PJI42312.1 MAG: MBL fold metallo-hydrolase [Ferrovibrio sp.]